MNNKVELQKLVEHFDANIDFIKTLKRHTMNTLAASSLSTLFLKF